jgi:hypothetical protein
MDHVLLCVCAGVLVWTMCSYAGTFAPAAGQPPVPGTASHPPAGPADSLVARVPARPAAGLLAQPIHAQPHAVRELLMPP